MGKSEGKKTRLVSAVLIYAHRDKPTAQKEYLMIHKDDPQSFHFGRWNGLGGKAEPGESWKQTARREFFEEAGILLPEARFRWLGQVLFPQFKPPRDDHPGEDWWVQILGAPIDTDKPKENPWPRCPEGSLHWVPTSEVLGLNLWPGDRQFLPYVFREQLFHGTIWYENRSPKAWDFDLLHR